VARERKKEVMEGTMEERKSDKVEREGNKSR